MASTFKGRDCEDESCGDRGFGVAAMLLRAISLQCQLQRLRFRDGEGAACQVGKLGVGSSCFTLNFQGAGQRVGVYTHSGLWIAREGQGEVPAPQRCARERAGGVGVEAPSSVEL